METVPTVVQDRLQDAALIAHLATCRDGRPHVAPVWYWYDGEDVVEVLTTGRKLDDLSVNPRVSVSIQRDAGGDPEWFVVLRGTASIIRDPEAAVEAAARINPKYGAPPDAWVGENTLVRIEIGSVSYGTY